MAGSVLQIPFHKIQQAEEVVLPLLFNLGDQGLEWEGYEKYRLKYLFSFSRL